MSEARSGWTGRRPWLLRIIAALALLAVVHGAAWWVVTGRMIAGVPAFFDGAAAAGWRLEAGPAERSGWPLAASVRMANVRATRSLGGAELRWTAERLVLSIEPLDPGALLMSPQGRQVLTMGAAAPLPFHAGSAALRVPFSGAPATLDAHAVRTEGPERAIDIGAVTGSFAAEASTLSAADVRVAPPFPSPFDAGLAVAARVVVMPPIPQLATAAQSAAAWQAAGGRAEVPEFALDWGPLHMAGHGGGGLDRQLQVAGRAELSVQGGAAVLTAAAQGGVLSPASASAGQAVLQVLALSSRGGPLPLPIVVAEQRLVIAGFPVLKLPPVEWPAQ